MHCPLARQLLLHMAFHSNYCMLGLAKSFAHKCSLRAVPYELEPAMYLRCDAFNWRYPKSLFVVMPDVL